MIVGNIIFLPLYSAKSMGFIATTVKKDHEKRHEKSGQKIRCPSAVKKHCLLSDPASYTAYDSLGSNLTYSFKFGDKICIHLKNQYNERMTEDRFAEVNLSHSPLLKSIQQVQSFCILNFFTGTGTKSHYFCMCYQDTHVKIYYTRHFL